MAISRTTTLRQERVIVVAAVLMILAFIAVFTYRSYSAQLQSTTQLPDKAPLSVVLGDKSASKKVVVYIDPVCDKCAEYHEETLKPLYENYVKTKKIQLEIRPLSIVTEQSASLTKLEMCGNEQGKFWDTTNFVYGAVGRKNNKTLEANSLTVFRDFPPAEIAKIVGLDESLLTSCLQDTRYDDKIKVADTQAYAANVYSTPTTFVGEGREPVRGYAIYDYIKSLVDVTP